MLAFIPLTRVISIISVTYAVLVIILAAILGKGSVGDRLGVAFGFAAILNIVLIVLLQMGWRYLWRVLPQLSELIFPDLNGNWKMDIRYSLNGIEATVSATATIKQSILKLSMEVVSGNSESETLMMQPTKDPQSGRPQLHYLYRVTRRTVTSPGVDSYEGAAILKLDHKCESVFEGNYFTSIMSRGLFRLTRIDSL